MKRAAEEQLQKEEAKQQKLEEIIPFIVYSFTFQEANGNNNNALIPSVIPFDMWKHHIGEYLANDFATFRALRSSCRGFMFLVSHLWNAVVSTVPSAQMQLFWKLHPQWPLHFKTLYQKKKALNILDNLESFPSSITCLKIFTPGDYRGNVRPEVRWYNFFVSLPSLHYFTLLELRIDVGEPLTQDSLSNLPSSLTSLRLSRAHELDLDMIQRAKFPENLTHLSLTHCRRFSGDCAPLLPKKLRSLNLKCCFSFGAGLKDLPNSITDLNLMRCGIETEDMKFLPPSLTRLNISGCQRLMDEALKFLPTTLCELYMNDVNAIRDEGLFYLSRLRLTHLEMANCYHITNTGLAYLPTTLRHLDVDGDVSLDWRMVPTLSAMSLTYLQLDRNIFDERCVTSLPSSLQKLRCSTAWIKRIPFGCFSGTPFLSELCLRRCPELTEESFQNLPPSLRSLDLSDTQASDNTLQHLGTTLTSLESLSLDYCEWITDAGMQYLPTGLTRLTCLESYDITDIGLQIISTRVTRLKDLEISGDCGKVTLAGLASLPTSLTLLTVHNFKRPNTLMSLLTVLVNLKKKPKH